MECKDKSAILPINKKWWIKISECEDKSGIKIIKHENADGNILEKLICVASPKGDDAVQLTMTHFHRQAKTLISKNPKRKHSSDLEESDNFIRLETNGNAVCAELSVGTEEAKITIFLESDKNLFNIAHIEIDLDDNPGDFEFFVSGKIVFSDAPYNNKRIWRKD